MSHHDMRCTCSGQGLMKPILLATGLPAHRCAACEGTLLALDAYRRWRDDPEAAPAIESAAAIHGLLAVEDAPGARSCPRCQRLMQRLRVSTDLPHFRIDRCTPCQTVWFDRGEWEALAQDGLAWRLDEVLSDGWQRQLQQADLRARREQALRARLGDDCLDELTRVRGWLDGQPRREELISLLRAGW